MDSPTVTISWGEFFDRLSILEIKAERLSSPQARAGAQQQLARLTAAVNMPEGTEIGRLRAALRQINEQLWDIENDVRSCEAKREFGSRFVRLAREVYLTNDRRIGLKRQIDDLLESSVSDLREYIEYGKGDAR